MGRSQPFCGGTGTVGFSNCSTLPRRDRKRTAQSVSAHFPMRFKIYVSFFLSSNREGTIEAVSHRATVVFCFGIYFRVLTGTKLLTIVVVVLAGAGSVDTRLWLPPFPNGSGPVAAQVKYCDSFSFAGRRDSHLNSPNCSLTMQLLGRNAIFRLRGIRCGGKQR